MPDLLEDSQFLVAAPILQASVQESSDSQGLPELYFQMWVLAAAQAVEALVAVL